MQILTPIPNHLTAHMNTQAQNIQTLTHTNTHTQLSTYLIIHTLIHNTHSHYKHINI